MLLVSRPGPQQQLLLNTISVGRVVLTAVIYVMLVIAAMDGPFPSSSPSCSVCRVAQSAGRTMWSSVSLSKLQNFWNSPWSPARATCHTGLLQQNESQMSPSCQSSNHHSMYFLVTKIHLVVTQDLIPYF